MFFRMIFGLPGAAFVTALLFVVMAWLVRQNDVIVEPPVPTPKIDILAKLKPTQTKPKPLKPIAPDDPPPVDIDFPDPVDGPGPGVPIERIPGPTKTDGPVIDIITTRPTIRPHPAYPENCRARGAQGVVIVEFDVTPEGDVVNPRIVSSANSCLDRTVLNTIQKWKYAPKQDSSGRPVMQRGVREFFNFQLTEE